MFARAIILLSLLCATLWAKDIRLFSGGFQDLEYENLISEKNLQPGDRLIFDRGETFIVEGRIGSGFTTLVLKVRPEKRREGEPEHMALRIPLGYGYYTGSSLNRLYTAFVNDTIDGHDKLHEAGIVVPKQYRSGRGQFVAVELLPDGTSFRDFLLEPAKMSESSRREARRALLRFAESAAKLGLVGDFKLDQLRYLADRKEWVLMDWSGVAGRVRPFGEGSPLGKFFEEELAKALKELPSDANKAVTENWAKGIVSDMNRTIEAYRGKHPAWGIGLLQWARLCRRGNPITPPPTSRPLGGN